MTSPLIRLVGVSKTFGDSTVLADINLDVFPGDVISVIGPSGAGKSTMLRVMNQLEFHQAGEIVIDGQIVDRTLSARRLAAIRARIGMVFQGFHLWQHMTALQNVTEGPVRVRGLSRRAATELAMRVLREVGLGDRIDSYPSQLSGGQQQRVAIARALAMEPLAILFDEPTSALDPRLASEVLTTMSALASRGVTMLVVTHEMGFARRVSNRVVFMEQGRIVEQGPSTAFFEQPSSAEAAAFLSHE